MFNNVLLIKRVHVLFLMLLFSVDRTSQPVQSLSCPHDFQSPSAQPDIPSIYFYSQHSVVFEEISGRVMRMVSLAHMRTVKI